MEVYNHPVPQALPIEAVATNQLDVARRAFLAAAGVFVVENVKARPLLLIISAALAPVVAARENDHAAVS